MARRTKSLPYVLVKDAYRAWPQLSYRYTPFFLLRRLLTYIRVEIAQSYGRSQSGVSAPGRLVAQIRIRI